MTGKLKIFSFLLVISLAIGVAVEYWGLDFISNSILSNFILGPIICGLIGLIPKFIFAEISDKFFDLLFTGEEIGTLFIDSAEMVKIMKIEEIIISDISIDIP